MKSYLIGFLSIFWAYTTYPQVTYNLGMEQIDQATGVPLGWRINTDSTKGYLAVPETRVVRQGKRALRIQALDDFGACWYSIPAKYQGKIIELRGYMKTQGVSQNGYAGLWMRVDGSKKMASLAFNNMRSQKITGTHDWKEYHIKLPLFAKAQRIVVGGLVVGKGQIWIDDLRLYIDNQPVSQVLLKKVTTPVVDLSYQKVTRKVIRQNLLKSWKVVKQNLRKYHQEQKLKFGASINLVVDGKLRDALHLGYADRKNKQKIDPKQIHQWASVSKTFTATAILQLMERGKLSIDDPITKYIPELKGIKNPEGKGGFETIRLYHLITHTAHFRRDAIYDTVLKLNPNYHFENTHCFGDWMKYKELFKFTGKPGEKYHYSNWSYSYLGMVIERVTSMRFKDYIRKNIFEPLGMKDAFFGIPVDSVYRQRIASCYEVISNELVKSYKPIHDQCFEEANGGLKATVEDMIKWVNFYSQTSTSKAEKVRQEQVLKPATVQKYFSIPNFATNRGKYKPSNLQAKAYDHFFAKSIRVAGFHADQMKSNQSIRLGHTGGQYHYISRVFWNPKGRYSIILTQNTQGGPNTSADIFDAMLNYYYGQLLEVTNNVIK